jgi:hypothetical protein
MVKIDCTLGYLFAMADNLEEARASILRRMNDIRETTTECSFNGGEAGYEGYKCTYKSTSLGAKDGILHLTGTECMTTEEFCEKKETIAKELAKEPLHIAPWDSVGFALSHFG